MVVTVSADRIGIQCRCDQPFKLLERRWSLDSGEAQGRQWIKAAGI